MRFTRLLLLVIAAAAIAGIAVPAASALTFPDDICPVASGTVIKVCPPGTTGVPYSYQIKGRDGTGCVPYVTFRTSGALPTGLSMSSGGLISGTPTQSGEWTFWIIMQDIPASQGGASWCGDDASTEKQFSITIVQGLQIVQRQAVLTPGQLTVPYSQQFTTTGGGNPTWTATGTLPAGLTLSASGLLSGTPTAAGDYSFKVTATDGSRSDAQTYSMSVVPKLQIGPTKSIAEAGVAFQLTPQATGGKPGYTWALDGTLPAGLTLDPATGAISGTPTTAGRSDLKLTVKDSLGLTSTVDLPFTVAARLLVTRKPLPAAKVGSSFHAFLRATGGVVPRRWVILGGRPGLLPKGLRLNARTGELTGTPKQSGTFRLRIQVTDKLGAHSAAGFVLKVAA
jgi:Putative Ig domain